MERVYKILLTKHLNFGTMDLIIEKRVIKCKVKRVIKCKWDFQLIISKPYTFTLTKPKIKILLVLSK